MKILIVGSGISGATAAVLFKRHGHAVFVVEERTHIGGNCFDYKRDGVTFHEYGPHVFHTNDQNVWRFLSEYTAWVPYQHKVVADTRLGRIPIPYSLATERCLGRTLSDEEIRELIFRDYSEKQWGVPFGELPKQISGRIPLRRASEDDRYFVDEFQAQPAGGFTPMIAAMLDGIDVATGVSEQQWRLLAPDFDAVVYTGKIDAFYHYVHGHLPYRSLNFVTERALEPLPFCTINQCNTLPFTRVFDHSWFLGEYITHTFITHEYPCAHIPYVNNPYYPVSFGPEAISLEKYRALAAGEKTTVFIGRLATFCYLDIWMAVAQAFAKVNKFLGV